MSSHVYLSRKFCEELHVLLRSGAVRKKAPAVHKDNEFPWVVDFGPVMGYDFHRKVMVRGFSAALGSLPSNVTHVMAGDHIASPLVGDVKQKGKKKRSFWPLARVPDNQPPQGYFFGGVPRRYHSTAIVIGQDVPLFVLERFIKQISSLENEIAGVVALFSGDPDIADLLRRKKIPFRPVLGPKDLVAAGYGV